MRISDWSSDVCSSDLPGSPRQGRRHRDQCRRLYPYLGSPARCAERRRETRGRGASVEHLPPGKLSPSFLHFPCGHWRDLRPGTEGLCAGARSAGRYDLNQTPPSDLDTARRSEEHTSELQSLMRISYAVFCLKKKIHTQTTQP